MHNRPCQRRSDSPPRVWNVVSHSGWHDIKIMYVMKIKILNEWNKEWGVKGNRSGAYMRTEFYHHSTTDTHIRGCQDHTEVLRFLSPIRRLSPPLTPTNGTSAPGSRRRPSLVTWWRVLVLDPADGHPEGFSLQPLKDGTQFRTGTRGVLLNQDPIHEVSVLLLDLLRWLTHLLHVFLLNNHRGAGRRRGQMFGKQD